MNIRDPLIKCAKCKNTMVAPGFNEWEATSSVWKFGFATWFSFPFLLYVMFGAGIVGMFGNSLRSWLNSENVTGYGALFGGILGGALRIFLFHRDVKESEKRMDEPTHLSAFTQLGIAVNRSSGFSHLYWVSLHIALLASFVAFLLYMLANEFL